MQASRGLKTVCLLSSQSMLWLGHSGRKSGPVQTLPCHPPSSMSSGGLPVISAVKRMLRGYAGEGYCENRWSQLPSKYAIGKQEMVTTRACGGSLLGFTTKKDAQRGSVSLHPHSSTFDSPWLIQQCLPALEIRNFCSLPPLPCPALFRQRDYTVQWAGK